MDKEEVILSLVKSGELEIDCLGRIWRIKKRHGYPRALGMGPGYQKAVAVHPCKRVRAEYPTKDGYLLISVTISGVKTVTGAHRVVWAHFNGPIPIGLTVNHENGEKADNDPFNLELASYSKQRIHALEVLHRKKWRPMGSLHPKTHLTEKDVLEIRSLRESGAMVKDLAAKYQMNKKAMSAICTHRTWKHVV